MTPEANPLPLVDKFPKKWRGRIYTAITALAVGTSVGTVCGSESKPKSSDYGSVDAVDYSSLAIDSQHFLTFPFAGPNSEFTIAQAWKYKGSDVADGTYHEAIDFIQGTDIGNALTWSRFTVLTSSEGKVCTETFGDPKNLNYTVVEFLPNGYETRNLHMDRQSIADQGIPNCVYGTKSGLDVKRGDILGTASDSGTPSGWYHLHFEVRDPQGNLVDPFDIYSTADQYPDPAFTNGIKCGPKALFAECNINIQPKPNPTPEIPAVDLGPEEAIKKYLGTQNVVFDTECQPFVYDFCPEWVATNGNSRLYEVGGVPDGYMRLVTTKKNGQWNVDMMNISQDDNVFQLPIGRYGGGEDQTENGVKFGQIRVYEYPDESYGIEMFFENNSGGNVQWTSDVDNSEIYVIDEAGRKILSSDVTGKLAQDLGTMPNGAEWLGWHLFKVGHKSRMLTLHYPGRKPVAIDLTQPH